MSQNRKKIPGNLRGVYRRVCGDSDYYENQNGFRAYRMPSKSMIFKESFEPHVLYTEFDESRMKLSVNEIHANDDGFYGTEVTSLLYCEAYNEIDATGNGLNLSKDVYAKRGLDGAHQFLECILSKQAWLEGASGLLENEYIDLDESNVLNILDVFIRGQHKMFPLILEHSDHENVTWLLTALLSGKADPQSIGSPTIPAKALNLALESGLRLDTAIHAAEKFNPSEVAKFVKIADFLGSGTKLSDPGPKLAEKHYPDTDLCVETICDIPNAEFTRIIDYMIKQGVIHGAFKIEKGTHNLLAHLKLYADYVKALDPNAETAPDLYPDNLQLAHDIAMKAVSIRYNGKEYNVPTFRNATDRYKCLEGEYEGYRFTVPSHPEDLIQNARDMGHCVDTYIDDVIKGKSKIVIVKKDNKPVMTIEVNQDRITQAKAEHNHRPDDAAIKAMHAWEAAKRLIFVTF